MQVVRSPESRTAAGAGTEQPPRRQRPRRRFDEPTPPRHRASPPWPLFDDLTTTATTAAPSPAPLLPTTSPFDPSLETLRPARASDSQVLVREGFWEWEGHRIRYTRAGFGDDDGGGGENESGETTTKATRPPPPPPSDKGPLLVCVHGFGGNADHWRKNVPELSRGGCRVAAIDLLGFGYSSKPDPKREDAASRSGGGGGGGGGGRRELFGRRSNPLLSRPPQPDLQHGGLGPPAP